MDTGYLISEANNTINVEIVQFLPRPGYSLSHGYYLGTSITSNIYRNVRTWKHLGKRFCFYSISSNKENTKTCQFKNCPGLSSIIIITDDGCLLGFSAM
jgi:hypothetical protein